MDTTNQISKEISAETWNAVEEWFSDHNSTKIGKNTGTDLHKDGFTFVKVTNNANEAIICAKPIGKNLGKGKSGKAVKVFDRTGKVYALKVIQENQQNTNKKLTNQEPANPDDRIGTLELEVEILEKLGQFHGRSQLTKTKKSNEDILDKYSVGGS